MVGFTTNNIREKFVHRDCLRAVQFFCFCFCFEDSEEKSYFSAKRCNKPSILIGQ